jgi:hypothetical protein
VERDTTSCPLLVIEMDAPPCTSTLLSVWMDTPCTSTLQVVERGTLCTSILLAVDKKGTPCTSTLLEGERDAPYTFIHGCVEYLCYSVLVN